MGLSRRKIVIPFMGGLGNQLFQYAAGLFVECVMNRQVAHSVFGLENSKNTPRRYMLGDLLNSQRISDYRRINFVSWRALSWASRTLWIHEHNQEDKPLSRITNNTRIVVGYFQDQEIVEKIGSQLISDLTNSVTFSSIVKSASTENLVIHVRFGDYLLPGTKKFHGLTQPSYYEDAVRKLVSANDFEQLVLVSDEIELVNARIAPRLTQFGLPLVVSNGRSEFDDLALLASAKGLVMSNSTFSWWGGWIGSKTVGTQVVFPTPWFAKPSAADTKMLLKTWLSLQRDLESC